MIRVVVKVVVIYKLIIVDILVLLFLWCCDKVLIIKVKIKRGVIVFNFFIKSWLSKLIVEVLGIKIFKNKLIMILIVIFFIKFVFF